MDRLWSTHSCIHPILNFSSKVFIEGMCVVALVPKIMTTSGSTFHPLLVMLFISG